MTEQTESLSRFLSSLSQGQGCAFQELSYLLSPAPEPQPTPRPDEASENPDAGIDAADFADFSHSDSVYCVAIHPAGELVASGGGDDRGIVWNFKTGARTSLDGHTDSVADIAFSPDGKLLASAGLEGSVRIWSVPPSSSSSSSSPSASSSSASSTSSSKQENLVKYLHNLEGPEDGIEWIRWHPSGTVLVGGSQDGTCWMWNATRGRCMQVFSGHGGYVTCGSFSNNGKKLVTGSVDQSLRIWNPQNGSSVKIGGRTFHRGPINCLECLPQSPLVLTGGDDGLVGVTNLATSKVVSMLNASKAPIESIASQPNFLIAAAGSNTGHIYLWDINRWALRCDFPGHSKAVTRIVAHPKEPLIFTASADGTVKCWDCRAANQAVRTFYSPQDVILDMTTDGKIVVMASEDGSTSLFTL